MKSSSHFLNRTRAEFLYALFVIILLPSLFIAYSVWSMYAYQADLDQLSQRQSIIVHDIIKSLAIHTEDTPAELENKIATIVSENPSVHGITYLTQESDRYTVMASSDRLYAEEDITIPLLSFLKPGEQPYIMLTIDPRTNSTVWTIGSYVSQFSDGKTAILLVRTDAQEAQNLVAKTSRESLLMLGIGVFLILLLLLNHFRLFDYSRLYTQLKEVDEMKDDFFSAASHELRTPLTSIRGYAQMALSELDDRDRLTHDLKIISQSATQLADMVENMLDLSRIQQGRLKLTIEPVNVLHSMNEVLDELLPQIEQKTLQVEHRKPESDIILRADPNKLRQILINLVSNAIKYTEHGSITVSYSLDQKNAIIMVSDTGMGIGPDEQKNLFSKFYRTASASSSKIQGTGLGLWITKQLVDVMHGSVWVESKKGIGSTFFISLPRA